MNRSAMTRALSAAALIALTTYSIAACSTPETPGASTATTASSAAPAAAAENPAPDSRLQHVLSTKTLKVCATGDYRPFTFVDPATKKWTGIDVDMVQSLATSLGAKVEFVQTSWKNLMPDYLAKCDIGVGGVSISLERAKQVYFSDSMVTDGKTAVTLCTNLSKYDTVDEINQPGVRSITPIGGTNEKFAAANYPKGELIRFEDNNTIFDEIIAGRADVMTTDVTEGKWVHHQHPELCVATPDKPFTFSQKAYMLPLGDEEFRAYVNQWLNIAMNDGTYAAATAPWFGPDAPAAK